MSEKRNPFNIGPGDVVKLDISVYSDPAKRHRTVVILEVTERYGKYSGGHDRGAVIGYRDLATGEESSSGISWITQVVSRNGLRRGRVNRFAADRERHLNRIDRSRRGVWHGFLDHLVMAELALLPLGLDRALDMGRVRVLFARQRPGVVAGTDIEHLPNLVTVHRRPFRVWVRANAFKFLATVAELEADGSAYEQEWADHYEATLEDDMRRGFEPDESDTSGDLIFTDAGYCGD